jgi:hypothetical protein
MHHIFSAQSARPGLTISFPHRIGTVDLEFLP